MGGFYGRLVGFVKRSFRKTLGRKLVADIQLHTLLKEVEVIVNSRPPVYVVDDLELNITLTPRHFLTLNLDIGVPNLDYDQARSYLYAKNQLLAHHFGTKKYYY